MAWWDAVSSGGQRRRIRRPRIRDNPLEQAESGSHGHPRRTERAALHAGGRRFDPVTTHDEDTGTPVRLWVSSAGSVSRRSDRGFGARDSSQAMGHTQRLPSGWFVKLPIHTKGSKESSETEHPGLQG